MWETCTFWCEGPIRALFVESTVQSFFRGFGDVLTVFIIECAEWLAQAAFAALEGFKARGSFSPVLGNQLCAKDPAMCASRQVDFSMLLYCTHEPIPSRTEMDACDQSWVSQDLFQKGHIFTLLCLFTCTCFVCRGSLMPSAPVLDVFCEFCPGMMAWF